MQIIIRQEYHDQISYLNFNFFKTTYEKYLDIFLTGYCLSKVMADTSYDHSTKLAPIGIKNCFYRGNTKYTRRDHIVLENNYSVLNSHLVIIN